MTNHDHAVHDALRAEAEAATAAYLVAWHVLRSTEYEARVRPEMLAAVVAHHLARSGHWFDA